MPPPLLPPFCVPLTHLRQEPACALLPGPIAYKWCCAVSPCCAPQVLDEADRLLEPSFEAELAAVLGVLPAQRQTLLFSATMTQTLVELQGELLQDAYHFQVGRWGGGGGGACGLEGWRAGGQTLAVRSCSVGAGKWAPVGEGVCHGAGRTRGKGTPMPPHKLRMPAHPSLLHLPVPAGIRGSADGAAPAAGVPLHPSKGELGLLPGRGAHGVPVWRGIVAAVRTLNCCPPPAYEPCLPCVPAAVCVHLMCCRAAPRPPACWLPPTCLLPLPRSRRCISPTCWASWRTSSAGQPSSSRAHAR